MIYIVAAILFVSSIFLFYFGYVNRHYTATAIGSMYVVRNKFFQESTDIRNFITPFDYSILKQSEEFRDKSSEIAIVKAYNWLEQGYHYDIDDLVVLNNGNIILRGGYDSWMLPIMVLAQKHQNTGECWVDCEDGTFLLVSILRALGIHAWANIGTIEIDGNLYGHAWATVELNGKEYLLETTLGESLKELKTVPNFYKPYVKFNEREIQTIVATDINKEVYPPIPPSKIPKLKESLY